MRNKQGFTLIELLVVIAIIALLSSVVLASLNTSRNSGANSAVKSNLSGARSEGAIFAEGNSLSFDGVCALTGNNVIGDSVAAAAKAAGATYTTADDNANASASAGVCHDSSAGWAAAVPLKSGAPTAAWCVDSVGSSKGVALSVLDTDGDITCN